MKHTKLCLIAKKKSIVWNNVVVIDHNGLFVYRRVQAKSSKPICHFSSPSKNKICT